MFAVTGQKGCGKSALLSHFSDRVTCPEELVVEYSYVLVKNKFDVDAKDGACAALPDSFRNISCASGVASIFVSVIMDYLWTELLL